MKYIVYDVETEKLSDEVDGGWDNAYGMGLGTAVTYDYSDHLYRFYDKNDRDKLIHDLSGNCVISFNGIRFDNRVLLEEFNNNWTNIDIFDIVVRSKFGVELTQAIEKFGSDKVFDGTISLNAISSATLGLKKNSHGELAPRMLREGRIKEVFEYNLNDVRLTRFLFEFARRYHYVVDGSMMRIPVVFSV